MTLLTPAIRAIGQITDRVFLGVVVHSVVWSALGFLVLAAGVALGLEQLLANHPGWNWVAAVAGLAGTAVMSLFLFVPLATAIASLFSERIAAAVEARFYPGLPPARPASAMDQTIDAVVLGLRIMAVQLVALVIALVLPGFGAALGWLVSAWAVGRGLFEPVAMLRADRATARMLYRQHRTAVIVQGALMTAAGLVPVLNLLAPILGVAAMVHVLHARVVEPPANMVGGRFTDPRT